VEATQAEWERLSAAVTISTDAVRTAEAAVERASAEHDSFASTPRPMLDVSNRDALVAELEAARAAVVEERVRVDVARERVRFEQARAASLANQLEQERAAADEAARLAVLRKKQIASATAVIEALPAVLDAVDRSVSEARVKLTAAEQERVAQNEELSELRRQESSLRERLAVVSDDVHGLEMQVYEKKLHLSTLLERSAEELGLVEDVLVAEYGPQVPIPGDTEDAEPTPYVRAEQQARLQRAERKLGELGRVNPLALEEFAALEERHKFLTDQLTDLTETRKDLLTIIDEIDEKMQGIFGAAFADTKAAFAEVFPVLFPGGTGSIELTNPDDLLTTGIEVSVRPAGKKIERLSLLSGGERSLAAVALLVAIFKARPSPFYILDEVEAALDDANLGRLLTIFQDLRLTSQLIIITHQKRTMEIADALYGVSMRQDGVSAVVGQRVGVDASA
jgi:chromosome segregation protein